MNQLKTCLSPTTCKLQPGTTRPVGWLFLALFLAWGGPGCGPGGSNWLPPTTLLEWAVPSTKASYSLSNSNSSHSAIGWAMQAQKIGVYELTSTSWSRVEPLPFADLSILYDPKVLVDDQDALTLVVTKMWPTTTGSRPKFEHQVATRTNGAWSAPSSLNGIFVDPRSSYLVQSPEVAMDDQGRGLLVWEQPLTVDTVQLWAARFDHVIGPSVLLRTIAGPGPTAIHVVANHDGTGFVSWDEPDTYYIAQFSGAGWSTATPLPIDKVAQFGPHFTLLSVDGSQAYCVVYSDADKKVRSYRWSGDHVSATEELGTVAPGQKWPWGLPTLSATMAADGSILAAWDHADGTIVARLLANGLWSTPVILPGSLGDVHLVSKERAAILFIVKTSPQTIFIQEMVQGSWQPRRELESGISFRDPRLSSNTSGDWLAFWVRQTSPGLTHGMALSAAVGQHRE